MSANGLQVSTPSDTTIVFTRKFQAPRQFVWKAMTQPELLQRWMFSPPGWSWAACEMDVRVGGKYHWSWNGPDGTLAMTISGEHREVDPPRRIVHTERMVMEPGSGATCGPDGESSDVWELLAAIELTEEQGVTRMTMTLSFPTKEGRDAALASGMERGMEAGYQVLETLFQESRGS
ncbi:MAG: SRPBCC domain-containing protein [Planctomycetales bacterium]